MTRLTPNAKRGTGNAMRNVMVRLDDKHVEQARQTAARMSKELDLKVSVSDVIRIALSRYLSEAGK